jgi:hypothetical protein
MQIVLHVEINGVIPDKVLFYIIFIFYNIKMNNFELNPCAACMQKYDPKDINSINQCCYDTFAAFYGASSVNQIRNIPEAQNCVKCVENAKSMLGKSDCDLRLTASAIWSQVPHYFPELLQETKDMDKAKKKCLDLCKNNRYMNECSENCITDFNAVETYKVNNLKELKTDTSKPVTTYKPNKKREEKINKLQFYISFILCSMIFIITIIIFIQVILKKN